MKKEKGEKQSRNKKVVISTIIFAILGITAIVVGFGLTDGWASVLAWLVSRWAIYIYIMLALVIFVVVWVLFKNKIGE